MRQNHGDCVTDCGVPPPELLLLETGWAPDFAFPPGFMVILTLLVQKPHGRTTHLVDAVRPILHEFLDETRKRNPCVA